VKKVKLKGEAKEARICQKNGAATVFSRSITRRGKLFDLSPAQPHRHCSISSPTVLHCVPAPAGHSHCEVSSTHRARCASPCARPCVCVHAWRCSQLFRQSPFLCLFRCL
jgi:hypothetical protein